MDESRNLAIYEDIRRTVEADFGYKLLGATPIHKGLLNLKWKVETECGYILIKQFSARRYPPHKMDEVKVALTYQNLLYESGVKCPKLHLLDGAVVGRSGNGENFVVMDFSEGSLVAPGKANLGQMYDIGRCLAEMHKVLNAQLPLDGPADWEPSIRVMQDEWQKAWDKAVQQQSGVSEKIGELLEALELQKQIIESIDLNLFAERTKSWAHSDLWADNILFNADSVACVVDFDRVRISYAERDIGRVLLSLALDQGYLDPAKLSAFLAGYNEKLCLTKSGLLRSLRISWAQESFCWVKPEMLEVNPQVARFVEEMFWLIRNWARLDYIIDSVVL